MKKQLYIAPQIELHALNSENLMDFNVSNGEAPGDFNFAKPGGTTGTTGSTGSQIVIKDVWED